MCPGFSRFLCTLIAAGCLLQGTLERGSWARAQPKSVVFGRVTDAESGAPLENTNVFLSSTLLGTSTRRDGTYQITNIPSGIYHLVGSRVGHALTSTRLSIMLPETLRVDFALKPFTLQRDEVEVVAREPREWKKLLSLFTSAFLGDSRNAGACTILNPEVVDLAMKPGTSMLKASTDSMIRVDNLALGYRLLIRMGVFEWDISEDYGHYLLYPQFELLVPRNNEEKSAWDENRRRTYHGSLKHFFSSLVAGTLASERFRVFRGTLSGLQQGFSSPLAPEDVTLTPLGDQPLYRLTFKEWMRVDFRAESVGTRSYISLCRDYALVDAAGNFVDPLSLDVVGDWTKCRVAELLPLYDRENVHD